MLERGLWDANEHYLDFILQQDRMIRGGNTEANNLRELAREARSRRDFAAQSVLAHRQVHDQLSSSTTTRHRPIF